MKLNNLYGKQVSINPSKYRIDWDKIVSKPQKQVKDIIRPFWENKQVCEEFYIPGSKMRVDLINFTDMIAVETSPESTHDNYNEFFNKNRSNYLRAQKRDLQKNQWLEDNGFEVVEIFDEDLKSGNVLNKIMK